MERNVTKTRDVSISNYHRFLGRTEEEEPSVVDTLVSTLSSVCLVRHAHKIQIESRAGQ